MINRAGGVLPQKNLSFVIGHLSFVIFRELLTMTEPWASTAPPSSSPRPQGRRDRFSGKQHLQDSLVGRRLEGASSFCQREVFRNHVDDVDLSPAQEPQ